MDDAAQCRCCREHGVPVSMLLHKATTAYAAVRAVRLAQARCRLPGRGGLVVRGHHVHHHAWGLLLVTGATLAREAACLHRPLRANMLCTGVALVADEFDLLLGGQGRGWVQPVRTSLDVVGAVGAAAGLIRWRTTWSGWYPASRWNATGPRADARGPAVYC